MKITVTKEPVAIAVLEKDKFEQDFSESFDLKKAVLSNIRITNNSLKTSESKMKDYFYLATDWGDLFKKYEFVSGDFIEFKMHRCDVNDMVMYKPGDIDTSEGSFTLSEEKVTRQDFMIVTAFNPRVDKHLEYMLSQNLIDYVNFEWRLILDL